MNKKKYVFFTFSDFSSDGGGRVRIYGILNALAKEGKEIVLFSNVDKSNIVKFHPSISHKNLNFYISNIEKKIFQFMLALFPNKINKMIFFKYLQRIKKNIPKELRDEIIFFEYLDNSFGYFLKENNIIKNYINDIHGIAPLEFKYKKSTGIKKLYNIIKYKSSVSLDYKVMKKTKEIIVVSNTMKEYFLECYPFLENKIKIVPDGVSQEFCSQEIDTNLLKTLKNKYISINKKNIFFAGNFKDLGGVLDLINAFIILTKKRNDIQLILIGDGEHFENARRLVKNFNIEKLVYFLGRVPYNKLKTYQQLADVIVCPDKEHPYSHIVPHIKYFDSLISNKIVINGDFKSTRQINQNEKLSINFKPSNVIDLSNKITYVLDNIVELELKYKENSKKICKYYTYENFLKGF
jgi:glycosyltransferase involved in cell wall biosynthesis